MASLTTIRISDVFNQVLKPGQPMMSDADIMANCETCKEPKNLGSCFIKQTAETTYSCPKCGSTLVIIGAPNKKPWPGRGYRVGDFSIRNAVDLTYKNGLFPRCPNALATSRDD